MKQHSISMKVIAVILTVIMIVGILPMTVFAEEFNETQLMKTVEIESDKKEKSPIVGEVTDKRDENTKVFERRDGSYTAVITSEPIHYEDNGEWKEIDNTLFKTNNKITNKENSFSVDFPTSIDSNSTVSVADGDSTLSFSMNNIGTSAAVIDNSAVEGTPELLQSINTGSAVEYKNIADNTNLKYELNSDALKESIILNSKPTAAKEYSYTVSSSGSMTLNSDGSVNVYDNSEVKFIISAPYMFDAENNTSYDVSVSLTENSDSTYTLKYVPNSEWLLSKDRVYPVTIDPTVKVNQQRKMVSAQVGTCSASEDARTRYYYLQKDSENSTELYMRLTDDFLSNLGTNYIITGAEVSLNCIALGDDDTISVHEILAPWDATTATTVLKDSAVLDFNVIYGGASTQRYVWDITDLANKWSLGLEENYGIAFTPYKDSSCNTQIFNETSLNYTVHRPWFEIDYVEPNRFTDDDVESFDAGRAGTLYLNKYSGTYYVERSDLSLNGNVMPVEAGAIYNPWGAAVDTGLYTGAYWINSHFMKMFSCGTVTYDNAQRSAFVLFDVGGERTYFYEVVSSDSEYGVIPENFTSSFAEDYVYYKSVIGDSDKCLWVKKDDTEHTNYAEMKIETSDYIYSVDSAKRVCAISSKKGEGTTNISFKGPSSSTISAITDGVGRKYDWQTGYDANGKPLADKLVVKSSDGALISVNTKSGAVNVGVDYDYTLTASGARQLTKITYPDGEEVRYEYDSDNLLTKMINVDGSYIRISYNVNRVEEIGKYTSDGKEIDSLVIEYESVDQRKLTYGGLNYDDYFTVIQQYDREMKKKSSVDNKGNFSYTEYDSNGDVVSYSTNEKDAENLITNGDFSSADGWEMVPAGKSVIEELIFDSEFENIGGGMCYVLSKINTNYRVYRTLPTLEANADGEVYTLSGWARNDAYTSTGSYIHNYTHMSRNFAVAILDSNGEIIAKSDFSPYVRSAWQFTAISFKLKEPVENAKVAVILDNQVHFAMFDDLRLVKSTSSYCVEEEEETLETMSVNEDQTVTVNGTTYRLEQCGCSCAQCTQTHTVTVDSKKTEVYYNCACFKDNVDCACFGCRQERSKNTTKNSNGDLLTDTAANGSKVMTNVSNTYTENRNYLASSSDGAGNTVYYNYNANTGMLDSYSLTGADSNLMQYTYNAVGALERVTQAVSGLSSGNTMSAEYTYSGDRITSMSHSGSVYTFEYNTFGNVTNIKVAGSADSENKQSIVSYGYDSKQRNNKITYGNGTVISYSYNDDGNISEISYSTGQKYTYTYNEDKALTASYDYSSMLASIYEDGRVSAMRLFTVANSQPVLGETVYSYSVNDDGEENVTIFGRAYTKHTPTEEYLVDSDSVKKIEKTTYGYYTINSESVSDFFGRTTDKKFTFVNGDDIAPNFGTEYTYADTETTATNKISRVKNTLNGAVKSDYVYTYDNRGNILTVSKSGVLFQQYVYDEASQVKAEYNYAEKTAMTYVYDANGNIVSKTPYTNVTSSDLSTATQGTAIVYGYGDSNWSDKLTSYNGQTISYDASGNPTSYRGETVTWNGRLMTSYTKNGCLYEYEYNSDGMRTIRRMYKNGELASTIRYIWDGDVLLGTRMESVDSDETFLARYLYDDSGELYGMEYKGLENAGSGMFAFIKNLQGDIVSITPLDSESNVEVNMEYDAWGKPIIQQASSMTEGLLMAIMMMVTNVGYRGYFYDLETELYYLRSRYYDPEIGRFINADDTAYLGYDASPLSMNLFAYCENNPVNYVDICGYAARYILNGMAQDLKIKRAKDDYVFNYTKPTAFYKGLKEIAYVGAFAVADIIPNGVKFYQHCLKGEGQNLFYNYNDAFLDDSLIQRTIIKYFWEMANYVMKYYPQKNNYSICRDGYFPVKCDSVDWTFALNDHQAIISAQVFYNKKTNQYSAKAYVLAVDLYNFNKNKSFGFLKYPRLNPLFRKAISQTGKFIEMGLASDFYSYGVAIFNLKWNSKILYYSLCW